MGTYNTLPIIKYINKELKIDKLNFKEKEEIAFRQLCSMYFYNKEEFILENNFKFFLQLSNEKIFDVIFEIFGTIIDNHKIITYPNLKYFYLCLKIDNPRIKMIFISFLLFQNKDFLKYVYFNNNIFKMFSREINIQSHLTLIASQMSDLYENKNIEDNYSLKDFLELLKKDENFFKNYIFIKNIIGASKYKLKLKKEEKLNYICDCAYLPYKENVDNNLNSIKRSLESIAGNPNKILYIKEFQNFLENIKTHKSIINLVIDYLKKYTQKDYCIFDDIVDIFKNLDYSLSLNDKKIFLFKMILIIYEKNDKLNFEQINRYLNIDYEENKNKDNNEDNSKFYDEKEFLNDDIYEEMINKINPYLEKFGLIPYIYFKVKANDKKIKRRLINETLKKENYDNHEKYLENKFAEYDYFYAIDVNFWNLLMNEGVEAPDYINNSRIAEEINIVTEEEKINEEIRKIIENKKREKNKNEEKEKRKKEEKEKNDKKNIKDNKTEENNDKEKIKNEENKIQEKEKNYDNKEIK